MDNLALHQRIAGVALAFAAGLLHRQELPAPHIHLSAPVCPVESCAGEPAGWSSGTLVGCVFVAYFVGCVFPPRRVLRTLISYLLLGPRPTSSSSSSSRSTRAPGAGAATSPESPPALFVD